MDDEEAWARIGDSGAGISLLREVILTPGLDVEVREAAMDHPSISDEELVVLLLGAGEGVVLRCLSCTKRLAVLERWLIHGTIEQRMAVAMNPNGDAGIALLALSDSEEAVRRSVMYSPSLTDRQVRWHARHDPSPQVQEAAEDALMSELGQFLRTGMRDLLLNEGDLESD